MSGSVACPMCGAAPDSVCRAVSNGHPTGTHWIRHVRWAEANLPGYTLSTPVPAPQEQP